MKRRLISLKRLDDYLLLVCADPSALFTRSDIQLGIGRILSPKSRGDGPRNVFIRLAKANAELDLDGETLSKIIKEIHGPLGVTDEDKVVSAWQPQRLSVDKLPLGSAEEGEIEVITALSFTNLVTAPVDRWVHVYVDKVRFWTRWDDDGNPIPGEGSYIRIETPGRQDGAVVLPVDGVSGAVCLVTQFRHPMRRLVTEAPRGFADPGIDKDEVAVATRELKEEENLDVGTLILLKKSYTDTGKMADCPALFLAVVDKTQQDGKYEAKKPPMLDPVWVPLLDFYEAVFALGDHAIDPERLEFVNLGKHQKPRFARSSLAMGYLAIEDAFTIQAALLALPRLKRRFPELFGSRRGPWS